MPDENVEPKGPQEGEEASAPPADRRPPGQPEREVYTAGGAPGQPEREGPPPAGQPGQPGAGAPGAGQYGQPAAGARYAPPPHGGYHATPGPPGGYPGQGQYPRRVTRRMDDRLIAGVASGLGAYFNIDPVVFRVGFVALTLAGGVGILIYLLCWVFLPPAFGPTGPPPGQAAVMPAALRQGGWRTNLAIGAVLLALVVLLGPFTRPPVVFALLLIGLGVMLMAQDRPSDARPPGQPGPPGPAGAGGTVLPGAAPPAAGGAQPDQPAAQDQRQPTAAAGGTAAPPGAEPAAARGPAAGERASAAAQPGAHDPYGTQPYGSPEPHGAWDPHATRVSTPAWRQPGGWEQSGGWGQPAGTAGSATAATGWGSRPTAVMDPARRRQRSLIGYVTAALALLAGGVAGALDNFGVVDMTLATTLALMLTVVGVGTLVASLWGRAGWLIVIGCLLLPTVAVASVLKDVSVGGQTGDLVERPLTLGEVQPEYRLSAGDLTLDLSAVKFGSRPTTVSGKVSAGEVVVILPPEQPVTVHARVGAGDIQALGREQSGLRLRLDVTNPPSQKAAPLTLDLGVGVGTITVRRGP